MGRTAWVPNHGTAWGGSDVLVTLRIPMWSEDRQAGPHRDAFAQSGCWVVGDPRIIKTPRPLIYIRGKGTQSFCDFFFFFLRDWPHITSSTAWSLLHTIPSKLCKGRSRLESSFFTQTLLWTPPVSSPCFVEEEEEGEEERRGIFGHVSSGHSFLWPVWV